MTTKWTLIGAIMGILVAILIYNLGYYPGWGLTHLCWLLGAILGWALGKWLDTLDAGQQE
jgi:uncharacterized membrane protein